MRVGDTIWGDGVVSFESEQIARTKAAERKLTKRPYRFKMLGTEDEYMPATRFREHGDRAAAERLVVYHMPLVGKIATDHRHYGLPVDDLVQEGTIGLMRAVENCDPEIGIRLAWYARKPITGAIRDYIMETWSIAKIGTKEVHRKLFYKLGPTRGLIQQKHPDMPDDQVLRLVAERLGVPVEDVIEIAGRLSGGGDHSLNAVLRDENGDPIVEAMDYYLWHNDNPENILLRKEEMQLAHVAVSDVLAVLDDRERRIFEARWRTNDGGAKLKHLAAEFEVSIPRIHQIADRAYEKVRAALKTRTGNGDD
jgi:RNA polymerase sigma-32 factor